MAVGSMPQAGGKPGLSRTLLVVLIVALIVGGVVVVAAVLFLEPSLSPTVTKRFTPYSTPVPQNNSPTKELSVGDINGDLTISGWSQSNVLINGTITAKGLGANPDAISFVESNSSGDIIFNAVFPPSTFLFSPSYTVDINVYVPTSPNLIALVASTVNGNIEASSLNEPSSADFTVTNGNLSVSNITTSDMGLIDTNGNIYLACSASCYGVAASTTNGAITAAFKSLSYTGSYTFISTNGSIDLKVPASGSFKITANTTNGSISSSGLAVQLTNHIQATIGMGTATFSATTTNGSVVVTGI